MNSPAPSPRRWFYRRSKVSLPPGTFRDVRNAGPVQIDVVAYGPGGCVKKPTATVAQVAELVGHHPVVWVNVEGIGDGSVLAELGKLFSVHPLVLEDVVNTHQRAKVEEYGDSLFVVARMVQGPPLASEQIAFFVGRNFLLTFQEDLQGDSLDIVRARLAAGSSRVCALGPDYLLYELLDAVIDGYYPLSERYGELLDQLELDIPLGGGQEILARVHDVRAELRQVRRAIWPLREAVQHLTRSEHNVISAETRLYFRDAYDHTIQLMDVIEVYRETCADLRDYYYNIVNNRTNKVMRTLTVMSTVFMPLSFIAGLYGMNFEFMPELKWRWGYFMCLGLMVLVTTSLLAVFWQKGWLAGDSVGRTEPPAGGA